MTILVGIGGGTGSGKDTLTDLIVKHLTLWGVSAASFSTDNCYMDLSFYKNEERKLLTVNQQFNYDHPRAVDFKKLVKYASDMKKGIGFEYPVYDFTIHSYGEEKRSLPSNLGVGVIQGIYALYAGPEIGENPYTLIELYDYKLYVSTPVEIAFLRRIMRDTIERGRKLEGINAQLRLTVRPMFEKYVHPTRLNADDVINWMTDEDVEEKTVKRRLLRLARQKALYIYEMSLNQNGKGSLLPELSIDEVNISPLLPEDIIHQLRNFNKE